MVNNVLMAIVHSVLPIIAKVVNSVLIVLVLIRIVMVNSALTVLVSIRTIVMKVVTVLHNVRIMIDSREDIVNVLIIMKELGERLIDKAVNGPL